MFLKNAWYVAAWGTELGSEPLGRTLLDVPVVLYRMADGRPVGLENRCCHRGLPLSMGVVRGDQIECGYHGLRFAADGQCIAVPGQSLVLLPGEETDYTGILLRELGLDSLTADMK